MLEAVGFLWNDLTGGITTALGGWAPSYNGNLTVTLGPGRLYEAQEVDNAAYGSLPQNTSIIVQQAIYAGGLLTFTTSGLSSGQSQWVLVEVTYGQQDIIPAGDPTSGVLTYANPANPTQPYLGPSNAGTSQPTLRNAYATIQLKYGTAAATGSQVPPAVDSGYQPMYLVNLSYGLTNITSSQLFVAGPAVTPNPPVYTAPFYVPGSGGGSAVTSVFGRLGAVVAQPNDYTANQVTNAANTNTGNTFAGAQVFTGNETVQSTQSGAPSNSPTVTVRAWNGSATVAVVIYVDSSGIIHFRNTTNTTDLMTLDQSGNAVFAGIVTASGFNT